MVLAVVAAKRNVAMFVDAGSRDVGIPLLFGFPFNELDDSQVVGGDEKREGARWGLFALLTRPRSRRALGHLGH